MQESFELVQFTLLHYIYVHKLTYQLLYVTLSKYTQEGRKEGRNI